MSLNSGLAMSISPDTHWLPGFDRIDARGFSRGHWKPREKKPIAVVWHTTGAGVVKRFRKDPARFGTPFGAALYVFQRLVKAGPHFLIGQEGQIVQMAPLDVSAWHVGKAKSWGYARSVSKAKRYGWWRERWNPYGIKTPRALAAGRLWAGGQCNPNTVGVEIAPPVDDPTGPWSEDCWTAIRVLARALRVSQGIPIDPFHQIGHSDAHPHARTSPGGVGWDPSPRAWDPWLHCRRVLSP